MFMKFNMKQRGAPMRAGIETSPARRGSLKSWFEAKNTLNALNAGVVCAFCERGLEAWSEVGERNYGYVDRHSHDSVWCISTCRDAGINTPHGIAVEDKKEDAEESEDIKEEQPQQGKPMDDESAQDSAKRQQPPMDPEATQAGAKKQRVLAPSGTM